MLPLTVAMMSLMMMSLMMMMVVYVRILWSFLEKKIGTRVSIFDV